MRRFLVMICGLLSSSGLVLAADTTAGPVSLPAVSGINGKASIQGGHFDSDEIALGLASVSFPLSHSFGLQIDGALGSLDHDTLGGGGAHLFFRDPSKYLLGAYASYHTWDDIDIWRTAAEVELYFGQLSFEGLIGAEGISVPDSRFGRDVLNDDDEHLFAIADIAYYLTDDLRVGAGYHYVSETNLGTAEIEYLSRSSLGTHSVFVQGQFGDENYDRITGGIRFYFGNDQSKSLIRRHREDDPRNRVPDFPIIDVADPPAPPPPPTPPPPPEEEQEIPD